MLSLFKSIFGGGNNEQIDAVRAQGAVIIDVRSPGEFAGGHAKGAVNIPLDVLDSKLNTIRNYKKPVIVCCASGMRSARAKALLGNRGLTEVYDAGSWRNL
ncbi:rhodanese-like domain-containing protein [Rudanella lutea]|uniref:rhodanese-like domain-containing protein n=1 Tax=Rudanella lutea TaxID=451374 RepID=UPI000378A9D0|nr:rhodanese-like domain-containing protein [Rudanella lutea]